jgi:hypothetical protein
MRRLTAGNSRAPQVSKVMDVYMRRAIILAFAPVELARRQNSDYARSAQSD